MSKEERVKFKKAIDDAMNRSLGEQNDTHRMCGVSVGDCVIDDKNEYFSLIDPDGIKWIIYQCLYCKRAFLNKG